MPQQPTRLFYDSEFTGLHQHTTLISLALVSECGLAFYAEFSDYAQDQCDAWITENVLKHTRFIGRQAQAFSAKENRLAVCFGDRFFVGQHLREWLKQFAAIEIWADCPAYDWVLFCELFGGALSLPRNIFYMPFDLVGLFKCRGIDPDCPRSEFAGQANPTPHNALTDAQVLKSCYFRLQNADGE